MLNLSVRIRYLRNVAAIKPRAFNRVVKLALEAAAKFWLANYLLLHFGPTAVHRYNYSARSSRTLAIKRRAQMVRRWKSEEKVPLAQPRGALLWTGDLRARCTELAQDPAKCRISTTGTAGKERVRARIPFPHPMQPVQADELKRLIPSEQAQLFRIIHSELVKRLRDEAPSATAIVA